MGKHEQLANIEDSIRQLLNDHYFGAETDAEIRNAYYLFSRTRGNSIKQQERMQQLAKENEIEA